MTNEEDAMPAAIDENDPLARIESKLDSLLLLMERIVALLTAEDEEEEQTLDGDPAGVARDPKAEL
jgi:hypothetical protein